MHSRLDDTSFAPESMVEEMNRQRVLVPTKCGKAASLLVTSGHRQNRAVLCAVDSAARTVTACTPPVGQWTRTAAGEAVRDERGT
jgi:hypothetical protein